MQAKQVIRLSLPSKGRLEKDALDFLADAGLRVFKPNPRQYQAEVPTFPDLSVIFQRPGDIVVSVRQGSVDFELPEHVDRTQFVREPGAPRRLASAGARPERRFLLRARAPSA